jgi:ABC-2 type transport system permease protein
MSGQVTERTTAPGAGAAGSIYDLGYQHYQGPRLGRAAAFLALYVESLRACFGLGRPARAKIVPVGLLVLAMLPAVIAVAIETLLGGIAGGRIRNPIRYDNYFTTIVQFTVLFVAAQAPELVGRDQRHHVLSLYFSRALKRFDYALAKLGALVTSLLILSLLPQATIFAGKVLGGKDIGAAFGENVGLVPAILLSALAAAVVMAALALTVAAFTPRRAYATAAIFAVFYVTLVVVTIASVAAQGDLTRYVLVIAPTNAIEGLTAWLFNEPPTEQLAEAALGGEVYVLAAALMAVLSIAVLVRRYGRIEA